MCVIDAVYEYSCHCKVPVEQCPRERCAKGRREKDGGSPCSIRHGGSEFGFVLPEKCAIHEKAWAKRQYQLWKSEMLSYKEILARKENEESRGEFERFWTRLIVGHHEWLNEKIEDKKNIFDYGFCERALKECIDELADLRTKEDLPKGP